ncbi:MAG: hypothetical protein ABUS57_07210 [Pseudomonadota bacterium]
MVWASSGLDEGYSMAYVASFEDFGVAETAVESHPSPKPSAWFERVGAVLGAGLAGAGAGFAGTIALGRLDTWIGAALAGQIYIAALYLAVYALSESIRCKAWGVAALVAVQIAATIGWPIALFVVKTSAPAYLLPLPAMVMSLILLATLAPERARIVVRVALIALFVTALAANQAVLYAMHA